MLLYSDLGFEINLDRPNILTVENPELFSKMVLDLENQSKGKSGDFFLFNGTDEKRISKNFFVFHSPIEIERYDRSIMKAVLSQLKADVLEENWEYFKNVESLLFEFIRESVDKSQLYVEWNEELIPEDLFKTLGLQLEDVSNLDIPERTLSRLLNVQKHLKPDCIILVQFQSFFNLEDWSQLIYESNLNGIPLLLLEHHWSEKLKQPISSYIIDSSLNLIVKE